MIYFVQFGRKFREKKRLEESSVWFERKWKKEKEREKKREEKRKDDGKLVFFLIFDQ